MSREMRNSGIPWIGDIPKSWRIIRNKNVFTNSKTLVGDAWNKTQLLSLTTKGIKAVAIGSTSGKVPDSYDTYQVVEKDNIVMCLFDLDCSAVFSGLSPIHGMISPAYKALTVKSGFLPDFYAKWFDYIFDGRKFMFLSKNIRYSLTYDEFASLQVVAPSLIEQQRIASFLDRKCAEIDDMIALQEKIIEELKAYKQSVITEAVTKGLNPDAPMKDSGIEWIGKIPEHWSLLRLKSIVVKIESGVSVNASGDYEEKGGEYVLKTSCVSRNTFIPTECKKVEAYDLHRVDCPVKKDTLIVSRMNTPELVGSCGYSQEDIDNIYLPDRLWQVSLNENVFTKFYWYLLISSSTRNYFSSLSTGTSSSMQNISQPQFNNTPIVIPCIDEQKSIVKHLDNKCTEIDSLITIKLSKIDSLKEYKKSIIYEYVTGKKEVIE